MDVDRPCNRIAEADEPDWSPERILRLLTQQLGRSRGANSSDGAHQKQERRTISDTDDLTIRYQNSTH
jgi:hypothetical protein